MGHGRGADKGELSRADVAAIVTGSDDPHWADKDLDRAAVKAAEELKTAREELKKIPRLERELATYEGKDLECVICFVNAKSMMVSPCRHVSTCEPCMDRIRMREQPCPKCREPIDEAIRVFF